MIIVGICGSSGSGKSSVCSYFRELGAEVLDCDRIYRDLVSAPSECLKAIGDRFGEKMILDGKLNRKELSAAVYSDRNLLNELNRLTHPFVLVELQKRLEENLKKGTSMCLIDAPLFFEAKLETWCDAVIAVISDEKIQIDRIMTRDRITLEEARARLKMQIKADDLIKRSDFVIQNLGSIEQLKQQCLQTFETIIKTFGKDHDHE